MGVNSPPPLQVVGKNQLVGGNRKHSGSVTGVLSLLPFGRYVLKLVLPLKAKNVKSSINRQDDYLHIDYELGRSQKFLKGEQNL